MDHPDESTAAESPSAEHTRPTLDDIEKLAALKDRIHGAFGQIALSMSALPRYRHLSLADLQPVLLAPLIRDRVALAQVPEPRSPLEGSLGAVIWASVSDPVHAKIREQIAAGVFPVRLEPDDWTSGETHWVLDVLAPDAETGRRVFANARQLVKGGAVHIHPQVARMIGRETLEAMGARTGAIGTGEI